MDDLLVVLADEGLGAHHQARHVGVLVQHMNVEVRRDAINVVVRSASSLAHPCGTASMQSHEAEEVRGGLLLVKVSIKRLLRKEEFILPLVVEGMTEGMTQQSCKSKPGSTRGHTALEQRRKGGFPVSSYGQ